MENLPKKETTIKNRIRIKRKFRGIEDNVEFAENAIDSLENSTENTRKRILPNRPGRGKMMKLLQEKEADEGDDFYNLIFAEKSSDEEFNPSQTELSDDSLNSEEKKSDQSQRENFDESREHVSDEENEISIEEEAPKRVRRRLKIKMIKHDNRARESTKRGKQKEIEEIVDIDLLDIDKIDEIEELKAKGIYPEEMSHEEFSDEEDSNDEEESFNKKRKKKTMIKKKGFNKRNNINVYNSNLIKINEPTSKKSYRKTFIDDEEPDTFMKKRQRSIPQRLKIKNKGKTLKRFYQENPNVIYDREDPDTIIIKKAVFDDENESQDEQQDDIMEYNDEFFKDHQKQNMQYEEENKKIIKKFNKIPEKAEGAVVKYHFMQEKLSQKDLLIEAIFTEYYNIQSLQEMQRLDDLNKKEMPSQGRREFPEYVRIVKRLPNANIQDSSKQSLAKIEGDSLPKTEEVEKGKKDEVIEADLSKENEILVEIENREVEVIVSSVLENNHTLEFPTVETSAQSHVQNEINTNSEEFNMTSIKIQKTEVLEIPIPLPLSTKNENVCNDISTQLDNYVTFSNPLVFQKIFENFNKKPEQKEKKLCAITGLAAKYYDPLTKQYYSNIDSFKIIRERYFQKEEDSLLFRIQTLSDFASQKKEKIKKYILSNENCTSEASKNLMNMVNRYGILTNDNEYFDKKVISHRIYNRNRENCVDSGMLREANKDRLVIAKKIFRDKYSNRGVAGEI